jgi:hypothetical protein
VHELEYIHHKDAYLDKDRVLIPSMSFAQPTLLFKTMFLLDSLDYSSCNTPLVPVYSISVIISQAQIKNKNKIKKQTKNATKSDGVSLNSMSIAGRGKYIGYLQRKKQVCVCGS